MKNYYLEEVVDEIYYKEGKENRELKMDILSLKIENELKIIENLCGNCKRKNTLYEAIKNIKSLLKQYYIVFNGTQDALFLVEMLKDGNFKYVRNNNAYLQEFGLKGEEIINKTPKDVFGEELGKRFCNYYKNCIEGKRVVVFEDDLFLNGKKRVFLTKLLPIVDEDDGVFIVGSREDITKRKEMEIELDRMANYDELTNIPNMRLFFKSFRNTINESKKMDKKFAVLFIDLDWFKEINDNYGHDVGDEVLVCAVKRIYKCLRKGDILGRIGGDEFASILKDISDREEIEKIVKDIQNSLRKRIKIGDVTCNIDSSIGITIFPEDGEKIEVLMRNSDKAMYKVKNREKGGYRFFNNMIREYNFKNKDGHVHTKYCPHGSDDNIEDYIEEAIKYKLDEISFTEHLPLPENFIDPSPLKDSAMKLEEMESYLKEGHELQEEYKNKIKVNIGVEVDYIEGYEIETELLLNKYGKYLNDGILSVHMIKGNKRYYCIDFSEKEFKKIIDDLGSLEEVYNKYYDTLIMALKSDLGPYKPKRIGHLNLVRRFNKEFPYNYEKHISKIEEILDLIKEKGYELDFNIAGLRKKECNEFYIEGKVLEMAIEKGVPMVLGSDSHSAKYIKCIKEFL
ncbi:histidinol-phosphatase HisJ [Clostridium perfringens]|uniref:histidinol-phosphatase HisJ n=1 Tax=Clostridium perfringens TaxID=1502 RepID=UPI0018ABD803|nr:histidinol-phosphatase HisJ [Clostridium perfringens]MBO3378588.1 histidinol-phosphatase HisJ [Clostridium perfringens]MCX0368205.1 histidinol-phosphatase HisJ [Clostridium perfringens]HEF0382659.1 histidinol-phosphatase HisJ [Clostridium perfringens]